MKAWEAGTYETNHWTSVPNAEQTLLSPDLFKGRAKNRRQYFSRSIVYVKSDNGKYQQNLMNFWVYERII